MQPLNTDWNVKLNTTWRRHLSVQIYSQIHIVHNFVSHIRVGMSFHPDSHCFLWTSRWSVIMTERRGERREKDMEQLHRGQPQHGVYSCCPQVTGLILFAYGCFNVTFLNTYSQQMRPASIPVWLRVIACLGWRLLSQTGGERAHQYAQLHIV